MNKKIILISVLSLILLPYFLSATDRITVHTIGDSTMADKDTIGNPERGWAMALPAFFDTAGVIIENYAVNGRSTKSFIDERRWETVVNKLQDGDYVFIQFGHNDEKKDKPSVYADPHGAYRNNLIRFINETRAKNAYPVLMTPIVRRHFDENGLMEDTHGEYPGVVRRLAKELNVPFIDMEAKSRKLIQDLGDKESQKLFVWFDENVYPKFPAGKKDNTHLNGTGAHRMAQLAVDGIRELKLSLEKHLLPCVDI
jgi:lysophospholipase L1-like esterase